MPLNIRNEQAEELAIALAKLTGETKTEAVIQALRERLERVRRARAKRRLADDLDEIALHSSTRPAFVRVDFSTAPKCLGNSPLIESVMLFGAGAASDIGTRHFQGEVMSDITQLP